MSGFDAFFAQNVARDGDSLASVGSDFGGDFLGGLSVEVEQRDFGSGTCESLRHLAAEYPARARNRRNLTG